MDNDSKTSISGQPFRPSFHRVINCRLIDNPIFSFDLLDGFVICDAADRIYRIENMLGRLAKQVRSATKKVCGAAKEIRQAISKLNQRLR
jgi:hypothetical protein